MKKQILFLVVLFSFIFCNNFTLNESSFNESPSILFNMGEVVFESKDDYELKLYRKLQLLLKNHSHANE